MAQGARTRVPMKRRRENRTDYRSRRALIKSELPRAVVRKSNRHIRVQIIHYSEKGDTVLASGYSGELADLGWKGNCDNTPGAYLTGCLAGKRAATAGVKEAVLDIGRHVPAKGSIIFAALKGLLDSGISIPHDKDILPGNDRISGKHLPGDAYGNFAEVKAKVHKGGEK
jgi:large subunit ribosomal protein L18